MTTYLAIITTALVISQIIRVVQNAISLHRQNTVFKAECDELYKLTDGDFKRQKEFYENGNEFFKRMNAIENGIFFKYINKELGWMCESEEDNE